jgi:hypothetical protein
MVEGAKRAMSRNRMLTKICRFEKMNSKFYPDTVVGHSEPLLCTFYDFPYRPS